LRLSVTCNSVEHLVIGNQNHLVRSQHDFLPGVWKHNYSIFLRKLPDGGYYLFSYFEYTGTDFAADCDRMAADPVTQKWWSVCMPCQEPFADRAEGEWWAGMKEIFHHV